MKITPKKISSRKSLVKSIGLESTLILQHIIDLQDVFEKDEIFQSQPEMSKELGISEYSIKTRIPELIKLGLINIFIILNKTLILLYIRLLIIRF